MPAHVRNLITMLITLAALAGFALLFGWGIYRTWSEASKPVFNDAYVFVATGLAGLVGGIVAAGFGQKLPEPSEPERPGLLRRNMSALGRVVLAGEPSGAQPLMASVYAFVYVALGLTAITTWVVRPDVTPDLVKNLASITLGMFLAIAQAFFSDPKR